MKNIQQNPNLYRQYGNTKENQWPKEMGFCIPPGPAIGFLKNWGTPFQIGRLSAFQKKKQWIGTGGVVVPMALKRLKRKKSNREKTQKPQVEGCVGVRKMVGMGHWGGTINAGNIELKEPERLKLKRALSTGGKNV